MDSFERRTLDLRDLVDEIVHQSQLVDASAVHGPHMDLSVQEMRIVEYLGDKGSRIMRELAERVMLAVNSVTSTVDNLERKEIVRRQRSEEDRRVVRVELTDVGRAVYDAAVKEKMQILRGMLAALNEDEQEIFMVLFRKIARAGWSQLRKHGSS